LAVIATLTKGYDLAYIWRQVDCRLAKDPAGDLVICTSNGSTPRSTAASGETTKATCGRDYPASSLPRPTWQVPKGFARSSPQRAIAHQVGENARAALDRHKRSATRMARKAKGTS
jgi:hypothetical protein